MENGKNNGLQFNNCNLRIDLDNGKSGLQNQRKDIARKRWGILAKALKSPSVSEPASPTDEFSVRRISSFMLLSTERVNSHISEDCKNISWYKYCTAIKDQNYYVFIAHTMHTFSAEDLMGFNNTGNICIWPSEEVLAFYALSNLAIFHDKSVLELGGGMSCLAGLLVAKYGECCCLHLTDGNQMAVDNVKSSLEFNRTIDSSVTCSVLKWGNLSACIRKYDIILCADCLFFDDARKDLIETIWAFLEVQGLALVMAPKRTNTLEDFCAKSKLRGFFCKTIYNYNPVVWEKHLNLLKNCDYDENIHYPILIILTKCKK